MPPKTKILLLIGLGLLTIILNVLILLPAYQINLPILGSQKRVSKEAGGLELAQIIQAISWISQAKKLEFGGIPTIRPKTTPATSVWQVQILNGSGIAGAAADLKEKIEATPGFVVAAADNTELTNITLIRTKSGVPNQIRNQIAALIESDFTPVSQEELAQIESYDIVIILGKMP